MGRGQRLQSFSKESEIGFLGNRELLKAFEHRGMSSALFQISWGGRSGAGGVNRRRGRWNRRRKDWRQGVCSDL